MGSWHRVCMDCRPRVNSEPGFAYDGVSSYWQDEVAMVQDKLVAANQLADMWRKRTIHKKSTLDPTLMTAQQFDELDKEQQLHVIEDAYALVFLELAKDCAPRERL